MTSTEKLPDVLARKPQRADARRNFESLLDAARAAFAENGSATSLEDIARRAQVGIGTLYRHFPTRQDLFESVYVAEVEDLCRSAADFVDLPPWDALVAWLHRFVPYMATKRALAEELVYGSELFTSCRCAIVATGEPMLQRAQHAGTARPDTDFDDVLRLVSGITLLHGVSADQLVRVLDMALDGVRAR
ncbi:MAG: transcriptional regulator TetR family [Ilumatobacteraceae bacterium]|nr:transcriptional regulator TetR family [Ilumatobacteraceae bacterium]